MRARLDKIVIVMVLADGFLPVSIANAAATAEAKVNSISARHRRVNRNGHLYRHRRRSADHAEAVRAAAGSARVSHSR